VVNRLQGEAALRMRTALLEALDVPAPPAAPADRHRRAA